MFYHVDFVVNRTSGVIARYIVNCFAFSQKVPLYPAEYCGGFFPNCVSLWGIYGLTPAALLKSGGFAETKHPRIAPLPQKIVPPPQLGISVLLTFDVILWVIQSRPIPYAWQCWVVILTGFLVASD